MLFLSPPSSVSPQFPNNHNINYSMSCIIVIKGILWQLYKLGLKVPSGRDENDGIGHLAELGSSWAGEAKTWPKIALRVGGRAENSVLGDGRSYKSTVLRDGRPQEKSTVLRDGRVGE